MGSYRIARQIHAAPDQVFRAFTDPALVVDWMDGTDVLDATGPLDETGTRYTFVVWGPHRFRTEVIRAEKPRVHETFGVGLLGATYRMVATLTPRGDGTDLDLLTDYTMPFGPLGRWIDRRWLEPGPRTIANREADRLVRLVSDDRVVPQPKGASIAAGHGDGPLA